MEADARVFSQIDGLFRRRRQQRVLRAALILAALVLLYFGGIYGYATAQIARAKARGVYPTAEAAARATWRDGFGGAEVLRLSLRHCGPNNPHDDPADRRVVVWFCTAQVQLDRAPEGRDWSAYLAGGFFVRVRDGWAWMPEGALPGAVGRIMNLYHLEGIP
ncbi:MAG: hypothetical protein KC425_09420 [Anaerolineales bacterium]|nr:hypothetical protein [Anaerolineales bacterium]